MWFPLFSFFEARIDGMVPNEYESPWAHFSKPSLQNIYRWIKQLSVKNFLVQKDGRKHAVNNKRPKKKNQN